MKLLKKTPGATERQKEDGRFIAGEHKLPVILRDLPQGCHSCEMRFRVARAMGYRAVHDSVDTYRIISSEKKRLENRCRELGIMPVFAGDYITLDSFPHRNIIHERIEDVRFENGVKTLNKISYFDILDYIKL